MKNKINKKNQFLAKSEYDRQRKSTNTAILLQLFWLWRLYVWSYWRWIVYAISRLFRPIAVIRRIVDFFVVIDMVDQYNKALKLEIDVKYDLI